MGRGAAGSRATKSSGGRRAAGAAVAARALAEAPRPAQAKGPGSDRDAKSEPRSNESPHPAGRGLQVEPAVEPKPTSTGSLPAASGGSDSGFKTGSCLRSGMLLGVKAAWATSKIMPYLNLATNIRQAAPAEPLKSHNVPWHPLHVKPKHEQLQFGRMRVQPLPLKTSTPGTIPLALPSQIELAEAIKGIRKTLRVH